MKAPEEEDTGTSGLGTFLRCSEGVTGVGGTKGWPQWGGDATQVSLSGRRQ